MVSLQCKTIENNASQPHQLLRSRDTNKRGRSGLYGTSSGCCLMWIVHTHSMISLGECVSLVIKQEVNVQKQACSGLSADEIIVNCNKTVFYI